MVNRNATPATARIAALVAALIAAWVAITPMGAAHAELRDHQGHAFDLAAHRGQWVLMAFGYTNCPDVCPTSLYTMGRALDALGPLAARVDPVFVSIDPERDTPEALANYVPLFHDRIQGVSGDPESIAAMAKDFRIKFQKVQITPDHYAMDHSASFILVSPEGEQVSRLNHSLSPEKLAEKLSQIISRS